MKDRRVPPPGGRKGGSELPEGKRAFSWWRALAVVLVLLLLRPSLIVAKAVLYSPLGWVALWLVLVYGYLFLHPRQGAKKD